MCHQPHQLLEASSKPKFLSLIAGRIVLLVCLLSLGIDSAVAQVVRKTQVDTSKFPVIRVFVSITDAAGNPLPEDKKIDLIVREGGEQVAKVPVSKGYGISSVLVLDVSTSMRGEKLEDAKKAAINYVNLAQSNHQIAIVSFSSHAQLWSDFTSDKARLRSSIGQLSVSGSTSLQEGVALALDTLLKRSDRKMILVLTDGKENQQSGTYANEPGFQRLIQRALREECSISTIGLGDNSEVDESYLQRYTVTHGQYVHSPTPSQLSSIFGQTVTLLQKERVLTYTTSKPDPDGTRRSITVDLDMDGKSYVDSTPTVVTIPGLLPHVAGDHTPYVALLLVLIIAPASILFLRSFFFVYRFRTTHMIRLKRGSNYIGRRDLNDGPDQKFAEGDILVICPISETPHHVRCWRYNKCHCFHDNSEGHFCYHRTFPQWLRKLLDYLFAERVGETGRTWLCRCAGDQEGC